LNQNIANLEGDRNTYLNSLKINLEQSADILFRDINRYLAFREDVTQTKPKVDAPKHFCECEIAKENLSAIKSSSPKFTTIFWPNPDSRNPNRKSAHHESMVPNRKHHGRIYPR
jgi:hypothetical protein